MPSIVTKSIHLHVTFTKQINLKNNCWIKLQSFKFSEVALAYFLSWQINVCRRGLLIPYYIDGGELIMHAGAQGRRWLLPALDQKHQKPIKNTIPKLPSHIPHSASQGRWRLLPALDHLDPAANLQRLELKDEQVWHCTIALQVLERKLRQPTECNFRWIINLPVRANEPIYSITICQSHILVIRAPMNLDNMFSNE